MTLERSSLFLTPERTAGRGVVTSDGGAGWPRREKYEVLPCHVAGYEGEIIFITLTTFDRKLKSSSEGSE